MLPAVVAEEVAAEVPQCLQARDSVLAQMCIGHGLALLILGAVLVRTVVGRATRTRLGLGRLRPEEVVLVVAVVDAAEAIVLMATETAVALVAWIDSGDLML